MSQHDYSLANASGATFRADLNDALGAIRTQNSGASAPTSTAAFMGWADTTNSVMKRRNSGDTAWTIYDTLDTDRVVTKTGAYTLAVGDFRKLIDLNTTAGAFTVTLFAVSAELEGWWCWLRCTGTGGNDATLDGSGAETIDGAATQALSDGQIGMLVCTGAGGWTLFKLSPATNSTPLPRSYLAGFTLSNNGADSAHDIDIAAGEARDSANVVNLSLASPMTKRIDGNWAEGSGGGGFPTGLTLTADTWYRVFLIGQSDGTTDAGFDTSATATNLLTDASAYSRYRQIGWVRTYTGTGPDIRQVTQVGALFMHNSPSALTLDHNASVSADTDTTITVVNAPPNSIARLHLYGANVGNEGFHLNAHPISVATASHSVTAAPLTNMGQSGASLSSPASGYMSMQIDMPLDGSGQFKVRSSSAITLRALAVGWFDQRGRDD